MILAAAVLTAAVSLEVDLTALFRRQKDNAQAASATCNIKTVGYRFIGRPGQQFQYAGDAYEIPRTGAIELLADRKSTSYRIGALSLPTEIGEHDQFGFRDVQLPATAASPAINQ